MNRIRAGVHEIGLPKVVLAARQIAEIDPYLGISVLADGVTPDNVERFLLGGDELGPAVDVVVDECDSVAVKVLLRERARELRLPVVMETSDRGVLDIERFDLEPDRGLLHGRMDGMTSDDVVARLEGPAGAAAEYRTAIVLKLIDADLLSTRMAASMVEMDTTLSSWPQLASDVVLGGASATVAIRTLVLGHPLASGRRFVDLHDAATAAATTCGGRCRSRASLSRARRWDRRTRAASTTRPPRSCASSSTRCSPRRAATSSRGTSTGTASGSGCRATSYVRAACSMPAATGRCSRWARRSRTP